MRSAPSQTSLPVAAPSPAPGRDDLLMVGMGEAKVTRRAADVLVAHGLGSCIALCMRDPLARVSGMAHIVLPQSRPQSADGPEPSPARFADTAVPFLLGEMRAQGASQDQLKIVIVGAAQLFAGENGKRLDIGSRNTAAVLAVLKDHNLRLVAHDVGGNFGRVCQLWASDGRVIVRTIGAEERELAVLGTKGNTK